MTATLARLMRMNDTASAGIGTINALIIEAMKLMTSMSMNGELQKLGGEVDHATDLGRVRHDPLKGVISATVAHTAQSDPPHRQTQSSKGNMVLYRD